MSKKCRAVVKEETKDFLIELKKFHRRSEDDLIHYALARSFKRRSK